MGLAPKKGLFNVTVLLSNFSSARNGIVRDEPPDVTVQEFLGDYYYVWAINGDAS